MEKWEFDAIGTKWAVVLDGDAIPEALKAAVMNWLGEFNESCSRFVDDSEVNQFRDAAAGVYSVSLTLAQLLAESDRLRSLTGGRFDPAIGKLMEASGYDKDYSLFPREGAEAFVLPEWSLAGTSVTINGPVLFDIGGIGKGYAIDQVAALISKHGYIHYLIDAGGDLYGTRKVDGSGWRVAIEYPGDPRLAAGVVTLRDQALAVSDVFRRRWGTWHHLIDPKKKESVSHLSGAAAVAPTALAADAMTSALFFASPERYGGAAKTFSAQYMIFRGDGSVTYSADWAGEVFGQ